MRTDEKDILAGYEGLKEMPFRIPDGYLYSLDAKISARIADQGKKPGRRPLQGRLFSLAAVLSAAAVLAVIAAGGIMLLISGDRNPDYGADEYALYQDVDIIPVTDPESIFLSSGINDPDTLSSEDIINYLVYIGIEPEEFDYK